MNKQYAHAAADAEAGYHRLAIPTPFAVGRVNCWLIEDDPLTLVDCGPNSGKSLDELEQQLAELGRRIEDLERLVITHEHLDHFGLAEIIVRRSGAEVCALAELAPRLADNDAFNERNDQLATRLMHEHGIADDVTAALRSVAGAFRAFGASVQTTHELAPGDALAFADRTLRVFHRPGHSPTDTVFLDEARGLLLGGDHLIGHISSNPLLALPLQGELGPGERPHALLAYLASLRETRAMELERTLPGHGEDVVDHAPLIDSRFEMHERRAQKIRQLLEEQPRTAHDIAHALWGNIAVTQAFLTLSEVLGHIDLLTDRGEARETLHDGVVLLEAT